MKVVEFNLNLKEQPEDFIVKEEAEFEDGNNNFLYLLIKRDYNLLDLQKKFDFSFAGIKDKKALTFQYVSFDEFKGQIIKPNNFIDLLKNKRSWYYFKFIKSIKKKIKPGFLKGNYFWIKINEKNKIDIKDWFINYYDTQRLRDNIKDGYKFLMSIDKDNVKKIKKNKLYMFKIDAFLSFLWNKSLEEFLKEKNKGYYIKEDNFYFFIPTEINFDLNYWPILGYKAIEKMDEDMLECYNNVIDNFTTLDVIKEKLKILRFKGDYRKIIIKVNKKEFINNYFHFYLPKGSYATMYLKFCYKI